jgi:DNA-binding NtrC family response regulator
MPVETLSRLRAYPWPGNVRELRNVIERALILDPKDGLRQLDLLPSGGAPAAGGGAGDLNLREALMRLERELILEALRRARRVRKDAAVLLGIDPRNLSYYMRKHGLEGED